MAAPFEVPFALAPDGALVRPDDARARKGDAFRCPACGARLDLHAGAKKRRHFHHRAGACSSESVTHLVAKTLIAQAVVAWRSGGPAPMLVRRCAAGDCPARARQALPAKVQRAAVEHPLRSGHVVDVALLGPADLPLAAIEVHHTHAVGDEKARELAMPWFEVEAAQVCESRGLELVPTVDHGVPWLCPEHKTARKALAAEARGLRRAAGEEARRRSSAIAALGFDIAEFPGFRHGALVTCPRGHDAVRIEWSGREPPWPRPPLVIAVERSLDFHFSGVEGRVRAALPFRRRYVDTCATCAAPLEPDPPSGASPER